MLHRVAVLGGGPGGLYAARLLKLARPGTEVVVHEQGVPDETFGFGVGLAARTQRRLEEADPETLRDILACSYSHDMRMRVGGREAGMSVSSLVAVGRADLLGVLQRHAEDAGVKLEFGVRRAADELDADLVIAADGVGSATRSASEQAFGAEVEPGTGWYLWAGTDVALDHALFAPERTEHGVFVTHAYPYAPDRSTFLVETDEATWRSAGFERTTAATPFDASDDAALEYLSDVFAPHLGGHRLIGNRTRWLQFRTVRCARWHDGRTVLLGDAAHTAHYSVGSGTKLAMEDAIALVSALDTADTGAVGFVLSQTLREGHDDAREETPMIEVLPDMPNGVTGIRVSGRLGGNDLRDFAPTMAEMLDTDEIRLVEVIAPDYEGFGRGGLAQDLKLGFGALIKRHSAFKRIAVVSDKEWVAHTLHALAWMVPGELALFGLDELERAKEWAAGQ